MLRKLGLFLCLSAAAASAATADRLERQVLAYVEQNRFSGSVLVARDGQPILSQGYGFANLEWRIPNEPDTRFRLGSVTKQFTAMAIAMLEQQGKLSASDPISKYIEGSPDTWKDITVGHLLHHTSGIPNFTNFPEYVKIMREPSPPAESLKRFRDKPLDFPPGTKWSYSNSGYILLGMIVEKVSGMSYEDFLRKNIFDPAEMTDTGYDHAEQVIKHRASGYERKGKEIQNASYLDMSIPAGAGALYSTTLDLMKWDRALAGDKLINAESRKKYFTPSLNQYAYGWMIQKISDVEVQGHDGGINGFSTSILRAPEKNLVVVTLCNVQPCESKLSNELMRLALGQDVKLPGEKVTPKEITVAPAILNKYSGDYELAPNFVLTISVENGQLMGQATNQPKIPLFAETETRFFLKVVDAQIEFQKDDSGAVVGLKLFQNGREMPAKKAK